MKAKELKRLAYHLNNARPDIYQPRKREREVQWEHCLENICNFLRDDPDFNRLEFITACGGFFKPERKKQDASETEKSE